MHLVFVINHVAFFVSHRLPIALEARRLGWDVSLITGRPGSASMESQAMEALLRAGVVHHRLPFGSATVNPITELWSVLRLVSLLRRIRPDIVHCASPKGVLYGGIGAHLSRAPSLILAISGMGYAFTKGVGGGHSRRALRLAMSALRGVAFRHSNKKVIVQNRDDESLIIASGLCARDDVHLIPGSGVDEQYFTTPAADKQPLVVFPARLLRDKGVVEFVEAVRSIKGQAPGWRFVLAGAADYRSPNAVSREEVQQWVAEGLVEWRGYISDMPALLSDASIVCLPSYREGLPKALLEAAAAGCAVITTDAVGCREAVIAGKTGDIVPPRDVDKLAASLLSLIKDTDRRNAYGRSGKLLAQERFEVRTILREIFGLYESLRRRAQAKV